jgi:Cu/Ag efflux protein CusF
LNKLNKVVLGMVSIFVVLAFAGVAFSAGKAKGMKMAAGQVKAIDAKAGTVTLGTDKSGDSIYIIGDKTAVRTNNKNTGTVADIKVGDIAAVVYYDVNGKNVIRSITVLSPAPASSPANKTATTKPQEKK